MFGLTVTLVRAICLFCCRSLALASASSVAYNAEGAWVTTVTEKHPVRKPRLVQILNAGHRHQPIVAGIDGNPKIQHVCGGNRRTL